LTGERFLSAEKFLAIITSESYNFLSLHISIPFIIIAYLSANFKHFFIIFVIDLKTGKCAPSVLPYQSAFPCIVIFRDGDSF